MNHHGSMRLIIGADILQFESLGQIVIQLHRSKLPLAADAIADHKICLGPIEGCFTLFGVNMRHMFQVQPINLSVAVWVGFLALFGIASDDGVVVTTYLDQSFRRRRISTAQEAREATLVAGLRRVRPCLMTTATTILALIPILTSTGRGSDIMVPMAIPSFGGMVIEIMTMLVVPVLYCSVQEWKLTLRIKDPRFAQHAASPRETESERAKEPNEGTEGNV